MLKKKLLNTSGGGYKRALKGNYGKTKEQNFEFKPLRESMRDSRKKRGVSSINYTGTNVRALFSFLESKIGSQWDKIYSEIIKKTSPNKRFFIDKVLKDVIMETVLFDENYEPYKKDRRVKTYATYTYFIDINGTLQYYENEDDLKSDSRKNLRKIKLEKIFNNLKTK